MQGRALFPLQDRGRSTHKWALNGCSILHELNAQLIYPTKITKRKWYHTFKHVLSPCDVLNVKGHWPRSVSWATLKQGEFPHRAAAKSKKEDWSPVQRPVVQPRATRQVRPEKKAECFPLRRRITGLKCVNSKVNSVSILPNGFPQMGPWHLVGATMEITLDKKLIYHRIGWELNPIHAKPNKTKK